MAIDSEPGVSVPTCPGCGSCRVAPGAIRGDGGGALSFTLLELDVDPWKYIPSYPTLQVEQPVWLCVACGLLWTTSTDLGKARGQIRTYGSAELKARTLDVTESLPRPAAAPGSDLHSFPVTSDHRGSQVED